jgi:hypothetical protein
LRQTLDVILAAPFFKLSNQVFVNQLLDGFTFLRAHHVYVVNQMFKPSAGGHILSATEMRRLVIKQLLEYISKNAFHLQLSSQLKLQNTKHFFIYLEQVVGRKELMSINRSLQMSFSSSAYFKISLCSASSILLTNSCASC